MNMWDIKNGESVMAMYDDTEVIEYFKGLGYTVYLTHSYSRDQMNHLVDTFRKQEFEEDLKYSLFTKIGNKNEYSSFYFLENRTINCTSPMYYFKETIKVFDALKTKKIEYIEIKRNYDTILKGVSFNHETGEFVINDVLNTHYGLIKLKLVKFYCELVNDELIYVYHISLNSEFKI